MSAALTLLLAAALFAATTLAYSRAASLRGCDEVCIVTLAEGRR